MVKSRAEISHDYRKRLKERDLEGYLKKERERRRRNYVPSALLTNTERSARQRKTRAAVERCRAKKKLIQEQLNNTVDSENVDSSGYESVVSTSNVSSRRDLLVVSMAFPKRAKNPRRRMARDLYLAKKELKELREKHDDIKKKLKAEQKRKQRILKRLEQSPKSPVSKAKAIMREANLTEVQQNVVRKELVFNQIITDQIRTKASQANKRGIHSVHQLVAGNIIRKYRYQQALCYRSGLNKNTLSKYLNPKKLDKKTPFKRKFEARILQFFDRDDNSRAEPGKADVTKSDGNIKQNRVLTDYLENLHEKFLSENPDCQVSLATFCRIRPKHVKLSAFITRDSCLCTRHQNMALTLKALRKEGVQVSANPENFVKDIQLESIGNTIKSDQITVSQWRKVEVEDKGKKKHVMRIVKCEMTNAEFLEHVENQARDFQGHVERVKRQYAENKALKEHLNNKSAIIQMDFAENYQCKVMDEVQSAYWNKSSVTLHPVVVYFKSESDLQHKSYVFISDTSLHSAGTVISFLDELIPEVKLLVPALEFCHYWTDSPTSQYRNKLIFEIVANHTERYGCKAVWNYFEAGHGKGPCDGLGGTVKRMADQAVNTGKVAIQNAGDFYAWAVSSSMSNVAFKYMSDAVVVQKVSALTKVTGELKPIKGTMKLHAVFGTGDSTVLVRETSCYCTQCLEKPGSCNDGWRKEKTRKQPKKTVETAAPMQTEVQEQEQANDNENVSHVAAFAVGDYVAARYDGDWYLGKILEIDNDDDDALISFMEKRKTFFQWPRQPDELSVDRQDIICVVQAPEPTGKTKRMFKMSDDDKRAVQFLFDKLSGK